MSKLDTKLNTLLVLFTMSEIIYLSWYTCKYKITSLLKETYSVVLYSQTGRLERAPHSTSNAVDSGSWTERRDERASTVAASRCCLCRRCSSTPRRSDRHPEPGSCSPQPTGRPPSPWFNKVHRMH